MQRWSWEHSPKPPIPAAPGSFPVLVASVPVLVPIAVLLIPIPLLLSLSVPSFSEDIAFKKSLDIPRVSGFAAALGRSHDLFSPVKCYKLRNMFLGEVMRGSKILQLRVALLSINGNDRAWAT